MFKRLFGGFIDSNEKEIDKLKPIIVKINALEAEYQKLSSDELKNKTVEFKARIAQSVASFKTVVDGANKEW
jgi:preprotein translocase subunit SecA